jgi:hypothetical protein
MQTKCDKQSLGENIPKSECENDGKFLAVSHEPYLASLYPNNEKIKLIQAVLCFLQNK